MNTTKMEIQSENNCVIPTISKLYLNVELADVQFVFTNDDGSQPVPAHKIILAAASLVFGAMFYGKLKEKDLVEIADATADGFKEFLQFFYLSEVKLTTGNIEEVTRLADKYDVLEHLNNYAATLVDKLITDNMCLGYQLALIIKHEQLKTFCEQHIRLFAVDIFKSTTFQQCDRKTLKHILELEPLMLDETDIFEACLAWAKFNCEQNGIDNTKAANLREQLGDCFNLIRFGAMTHDDFVKHTVAYEEMFTRDELVHIFYKTSSKFTLNKFNQNSRSNTFSLWNNAQMLVCSQEISTSNSYYIQCPESVWFTTSVLSILGEIYCSPLIENYQRKVDLNFNVTVFEFNTQPFDVNTTKKVIFNGTVAYNGHAKEIIVPLRQPLTIKPKWMYEICLDSAAPLYGDYYTFGQPWKSEVKLNENFYVKFHQFSDKACRGLVSRLCFNQI